MFTKATTQRQKLEKARVQISNAIRTMFDYRNNAGEQFDNVCDIIDTLDRERLRIEGLLELHPLARKHAPGKYSPANS